MKEVLLTIVIGLGMVVVPLSLKAFIDDDDDLEMYQSNPLHPLAPRNQIYQESGIQLYNQDEVLQSEAFKQASLADKQQMLEDHFSKKRVEAYLTSLKNSAANAAIAAPIALAFYLLRNPLSRIPNFIGVGGSIAFSGIIVGYISKCYEQAYALLNTVKKLYLSSEGSTELEKDEIVYVRNKPWIESGIQKAIERAFVHAYSGLYVEHFQGIIKIGLRLPREPKKLVYNQELINKTLIYPKDSLLGIKRYCIRHVASSYAQNVRKMAAYFWGAPGVGKTRAARLIGQVLDVPCEVISLGDASVESIIGTYQKPGLLLEMLAKSGKEGEINPKNMILLIDDADRVLLNRSEYGLQSFILTLLEPETKTFYSPFLQADVDISRLGIILAGNTEIKEDEALKNRLEVIHFDGHTADYKKAVVWGELFESVLNIHANGDLPISLEDLDQKDKDLINNLIERDIDPGFRTLKRNLMNYLEDKVLCKYFGQGEATEVCFKPAITNIQNDKPELNYEEYHDDNNL